MASTDAHSLVSSNGAEKEKSPIQEPSLKDSIQELKSSHAVTESVDAPESHQNGVNGDHQKPAEIVGAPSTDSSSGTEKAESAETLDKQDAWKALNKSSDEPAQEQTAGIVVDIDGHVGREGGLDEMAALTTETLAERERIQEGQAAQEQLEQPIPSEKPRGEAAITDTEMKDDEPVEDVEMKEEVAAKTPDASEEAASTTVDVKPKPKGRPPGRKAQEAKPADARTVEPKEEAEAPARNLRRSTRVSAAPKKIVPAPAPPAGKGAKRAHQESEEEEEEEEEDEEEPVPPKKMAKGGKFVPAQQAPQPAKAGQNGKGKRGRPAKNKN